VYTGTFTPPTAPLTATQSASTNISAITGTQTALLTCQSNRFVDNSTNNFALTPSGTPSVQAFSPFAPTATYSPAVHGGSGYFDGSGDYLSTLTNSAFVLSGDFTIEAWVYPISIAGSDRIVFSTGFPGLAFYIKTTGSFAFVEQGVVERNSGVTVPLFSWTHLAASKSGATFLLFINGQVVVTTSIGSLAQSSVAVGENFYGHIGNLRVVKGTAVYTGNFTPPTAPLSTSGETSAAAYLSTANVNTSFAAANTSLLLNFTNAAITDATARNVLETVDNARISTAQSKWGGGSMYFDGSNDNLVVPFNSLYSLDTGDFTVEGWFYFANLNTNSRGLVALGDGALASSPFIYNAWSLVYRGTEANNQLQWFRYDGTEYGYLTAGVTLAANTWTHIAISRGSGVLRIFVGGVSYYSQANSQSFGAVNTNPLRVGQQSYAGANRYWSGYISDLRITRGYARYTDNFTPPTGSFRLK
jgi:hypothetical protein